MSPEGRFGASAAYDPRTGTVLMFGGRLESGTPVNDTWAGTGTTWGELDGGAGGPQPGEGSDMAWDPATMQMVLLTRSGVSPDPAETWVWTGSHWSRPAGGTLPLGPSSSPMWFDPISRSLLAVGCCVGPPAFPHAINTTWNWKGAAWTRLAPPSNAPIDGSTMALDPALRRLVLCTCNASASSEPELSVWDGSDWAPLPAGPLPVVGGTEMTDDDRGELLLLGTPESAAQSGQSPVEVWRLTGSTWSQLGTTG